MSLTKSKIEKLAAEGGKPRRESDGGGLYIEASPTGAKLWKMAYRFLGKQKTLSFGGYPAVGIVDARSMREDAKKMLAAGQDPGAAKRLTKIGGNEKTFDAWAGEFIAFRKSNIAKPTAESTLDKYEWSRQAVFRQIGRTPITSLKIPEIVSAIRAIEGTGALHKSTKAKTFISQVFRFAAASGAEVMDPGSVIKDAVQKPKERNHAAIIDPNRLGELLRAIDDYSGDASTLFALRLAPHLFLRDGELRALRWSWVNHNQQHIMIPAGAMKMKRDHIVPLSAQVMSILAEIKAFSGSGDHVFPSPTIKGRSISSNTLNAAIRRLGFTKEEHTFHGFRTTAATMIRQLPVFEKDFTDKSVEMQLSHSDHDRVRAAYDKFDRFEERRHMMQLWSDRIDVIRRMPASA